MENNGWVGVDLDGTLAHYDGWKDGAIGEPIPLMVEKVKELIAAGATVKVMTARVSKMASDEERRVQHIAITLWTERHIGVRLRAVCEKDFGMIALYDDRAVAVEHNTGKVLGGVEPL